MRFLDARLVAAVGRGERRAFDRIYRIYKDDLYTVTFHMVGEQATTEDILHDVYIAFARAAAGLQLNGSLRSYLLKSCINRARVFLSRRSPELVPNEMIEERPDRDDGPAEKLARENDASQVRMALMAIRREQREVVVLRVYGDLTFKEIAKALAIPSNTAQSRFRYALSALRKILDKKEVTYGPP